LGPRGTIQDAFRTVAADGLQAQQRASFVEHSLGQGRMLLDASWCRELGCAAL
jgi:hypothetical protein